MRRPGLFVTFATLACAALFALAPGLDLFVSGLFFGAGGFAGDHSAVGVMRAALYPAPLALALGAAALWAAARARLWRGPAPSGWAVIFLAASFALGPGLVANVILKDHSHRPRPVQVSEFGGPSPYRPFYRTDGACATNCSFVSGEASAAFWTLAPASLAPPPYRCAAIGAALAFGMLVSLLRLALGGHFLSDVVFAGLFTALVVIGMHRAVLTRRPVQSKLEQPRL